MSVEQSLKLYVNIMEFKYNILNILETCLINLSYPRSNIINSTEGHIYIYIIYIYTTYITSSMSFLQGHEPISYQAQALNI